MSNRQPSLLDWFLVFILAIVWGVSFLFIKRSVTVFSPLQMAMWRMVLAMAVYLPIAISFWSKINWKYWKQLIVVAFCGSAIPNFLFAIAQQHVDSSLAGILNSLTPLFTLVIGVSFFGMTFSQNKLVGVLLGISGASILIYYNSGGGMSGHAFFALLCALATVCYAINANVVNKYLRDQHPAAIASAAFMLTGWIFVLGLWFSHGWEVVWTNPEGKTALGYVFYLAAIGTAGGSILYFWLLQRTSAIFATSVTYLLPIMAMILGSFDGESISFADMFGTGIILTGLYLARK